VPGGRLDLSRAAGIKLTSSRMPVVQAVLNGRCFLGLVDCHNSDLETLQVQDPDFVAKFFQGPMDCQLAMVRPDSKRFANSCN